MNTDINIQKYFLEKHKKYENKYGKNEIYWGIGIENEVYLEFEKKAKVTHEFFKNNHRRERYSVDYFNTYKDFSIKYAFEEYSQNSSEPILLPILINSHSFMYTDHENNHKTTYSIKPVSNPKFTISIDEYLKKECRYFRENFDINFTYDGDTIEFITQQFYNSKIDDVISELKHIKNEFITNVSKDFPVKKYGNINIMKENYPFAIHLTNTNNISMFNNGTYHFNFTLPTPLNNNGQIIDKEKFVNDHRKAIRLFQVISPILIAIYGTPDIFSKYSNVFSGASQRCAVSRYIGIGTYDTDEMPTGKILTKEINTISGSELPFWWYHQFYASCAYKKLNSIGLDINFNKHYLHGIEIRIFDYFPEENLPEVLEFLVNVFDHSLEIDLIKNPIYTQEWNNLTANILREGKNYTLTPSELYMIHDFFQINFHESYNNIKVSDLYQKIRICLKKIYGNWGKCSKYMIKQTELQKTEDMVKNINSIPNLKTDINVIKEDITTIKDDLKNITTFMEKLSATIPNIPTNRKCCAIL